VHPQIPISTLLKRILHDLSQYSRMKKRQNPWECGGIGRRAGLKIRRAL
tara:strand:+ start:3034 stop:3180 length:147 start_codon:yes stop_codon:yes gene_type:complete